MSAWRRVALENLPEYTRLISDAANPNLLWIDLEIAFEKVYQTAKETGSLDDRLIERFYKYADWCLATTDQGHGPTEVSSAVACAFYEHIILNRRIREDLHRWIGPAKLERLSGSFTYHYPVAEFEVFREDFLQKYKQTKPTRSRL